MENAMIDHWPIDPALLLAYTLAALALVIAPGPAQALVLTRTVEGGTRAGLLTSVGLEIGSSYTRWPQPWVCRRSSRPRRLPTLS